MDTPGLGMVGGPEKRKISPDEQPTGESKIEPPVVSTPEIQVEPPTTTPETEVQKATEPTQETVLEEQKLAQNSFPQSNLDISAVENTPLNTTGQAKELLEEVNRTSAGQT